MMKRPDILSNMYNTATHLNGFKKSIDVSIASLPLLGDVLEKASLASFSMMISRNSVSRGRNSLPLYNSIDALQKI